MSPKSAKDKSSTPYTYKIEIDKATSFDTNYF